jgi:hypothetical protein
MCFFSLAGLVAERFVADVASVSLSYLFVPSLGYDECARIARNGGTQEVVETAHFSGPPVLGKSRTAHPFQNEVMR